MGGRTTAGNKRRYFAPPVRLLRQHPCRPGYGHHSLFLYSIPAFLALIGLCLQPDGSVPKAERDTGVSYQQLHRMLLIFHEYRERLTLLLRRESLWNAASNPLLRQLLPLLDQKFPPWLQSAFFQAYCSPAFLHRRIAGAFPHYFGALS